MSTVQYAPAPAPAASVSFAQAPVSYSHAPVSYSGAPVTYAAPVSSVSMPPVTYSAPPVTYAMPTYTIVPAEAPKGVVQKAWDNHFEAFGKQDVEKILLDYCEVSVITVYNQTDKSKTVYEGLAGAKQCFRELFADLYDLSDLTAPVIDVREAEKDEPGSVFLIWSCKASGYKEATDTFVFDAAGKILRQNVVVSCDREMEDAEVSTEEPSGAGAVHSGWANHFEAFGAQNVEQILLDYTEDSEITVYNHLKGEAKGKTVYKGLAEVQKCFEGLFKSLKNTKDLAAPVQHVEEPNGGIPGSVFLIWCCPASGYQRATDTFIFNDQGKILRQNVVVAHVPRKAMGCC